MNTSRRRAKMLILGATLIVVIAGLVGFMIRPSSAVHAQSRFASINPHAIFDPQLNKVGSNAAAHATISHALASSKSAALVKTLPFWSGIFSYNGTPGITYPFQMVGTNPAAGGSTTIQTVIIPINVTFLATGDKYLAGPVVGPTIASPEFQKASFYSGHTQYGDADMRAEFSKIRKDNYHVLLSQPDVLPTVNLTVTPANGTELVNSNNVVFGDIEINYWDTTIQNLIFSRFHISPTVYPIFLTNNIVLYQGDPVNGCCIIGYHNAVPYQASNGVTTKINVYAWSSYTEGIFPPADGIVDIDALSHEIGETLNDPFVDNVVPNWEVPSEPQYGCSNSLEVGDPLVAHAFVVNGYHPQDLVFYSWFSRQDPSVGFKGWYTFQNEFGPNTTTC